MQDLNKEIVKVFGNRLRVRVSGICIQENKILLVKHHSLGIKGTFWSPPGGGTVFGELAKESLVREFLEETGLHIEVVKFLFIYEYLDKPLHAIELFFEVKIMGGELMKGNDPELVEDMQIIQEVGFADLDIIKRDPDLYHPIFSRINILYDLLKISGYHSE